MTLPARLPEYRYVVLHFHRESDTGVWDLWEDPVPFKTLEEAEEWKRVEDKDNEATKAPDAWRVLLYRLDLA